MTLTLAQLPAGGGTLALSPQPGRSGRYLADFTALRLWAPDLVISLTTGAELAGKGAEALHQDLQDWGIPYYHLPITDFGCPDRDTTALWHPISAAAITVLGNGGKVLVHCLGGCGRSGMMVLKLLVTLGEPPEQALIRLRQIRPCAVETEAQYLWASS